MSELVSAERLKLLCRDAWGAESKPGLSFSKPHRPLRSLVAFDQLDAAAKAYAAELLLLCHCLQRGAYWSDGDPQWFLMNAAREIRAPATNRRTPVAVAALCHVASEVPEHIALGTLYLIAELECFLRERNRYLTFQGVIVRRPPKAITNKKPGQRINRIGEALSLFSYRNKTAAAMQMKSLERRLPGGLRGRLEWVRNGFMHGEFPFIATEGYLCGLLVCMLYYQDPGYFQGQ